MSISTDSSRPPETILNVANDRTLAFANNGNLTSPLVVLFFPGALSVGRADEMSPYLASRGAHYICVTTPGNGNTSPPAKGVTYAATIASDTTAILNHLYPNSTSEESALELYVGGGSFGTVPAQILYGSSFDIFPYGRYMKGLFLLSGFPPTQTKRKSQWEKDLSWTHWIGIGAPARVIPFHIVPKIMSGFLGHHIKTQEKAEKFMRKYVIEKMSKEEKEEFDAWCKRRGRGEEEVIREIAEMNRLCVEKTWEGFRSMSDVLKSDWWDGKKLEDMDEAHTTSRRVLVVSGKADDLITPKLAEFMADVYPNAKLKWLGGGHMCTLFHIEEIFEELLSAPWE